MVSSTYSDIVTKNIYNESAYAHTKMHMCIEIEIQMIEIEMGRGERKKEIINSVA